MGERELFLVLASMFFFTMTSMSVNRFCLNNNEVIMRNEFENYAISLAQRLIEEGKTRAFDVAVETNPATNPPNDFTYPLGPRFDEHYPNFTDVDDFHNLSMTVNTPKADYHVSVQVGYVEEGNPDQIVYHKTWHKKMTVTVSSEYIAEDIVLSHVYSYFEF